jgi:hypothetical protein
MIQYSVENTYYTYVLYIDEKPKINIYSVIFINFLKKDKIIWFDKKEMEDGGTIPIPTTGSFKELNYTKIS